MGKRSVDANEKRYGRDTCKNQLILIRAFLRWLHRSDLQWKLPSDYLFPRIKIEWLTSEVSGEVAVLRRLLDDPQARRVVEQDS